MIRFVSWTLAILAILVFCILLEGGSIGAYLMLTPGIISFLMPLFAALAVWPAREWGQAWKDAFDKGDSPTAARSSAIWEFEEKASYATGIIAFIAGIIILLTHLSSPAQLGRALAAGLNGPLYALLIALACRILRARVDRKRG